MAAAAHFHAPSHSPRYLLALLILLLPTLLISLLAFLVDILLFVPHMQWGGWIVLAATILLVTCGVLTCAMRRTLVSRKARKRRIAENGEMSGESFYNRQYANAASAGAGVDVGAGAGQVTDTGMQPTSVNRDAKEAALLSHSATSDSVPTFATFRTNSTTREADDDRAPLNARTPPPDPQNVPPIPDQYGPMARGDGRPYYGTRDLGSSMPPMPPPMASGPGPGFGPGQGMYPEHPDGPDPGLRRQFSDTNMVPRRGGPPGFGPRGRGGYPPRGYGRGGPYGGPRGPPPPNGRGGYMNPNRGGPPGLAGRGGRGARGARGGQMGYPPGPGGPSRSFDSYVTGPGPQRMPGPGFVYGGPGYASSDYGPPPNSYVSRGPSPGPGFIRSPSAGPVDLEHPMDGGPIGQAIEMQPQIRSQGPQADDGDSGGHAQANRLAPEGGSEPLESPSSLYSPRE